MVLLGRSALAVGLLAICSQDPAAAECLGDCNADGRVTVDELATGVRIGLGQATTDTCRAIDPNHDDTATVDELVRAVGAALEGCPWSFTDVTFGAGFDYRHTYLGYTDATNPNAAMFMGGVAAGDYDGDGWVDLYAVGGGEGANRLFRNLGDGTFDEVASQAGLTLEGTRGCGPTFADVDGDGRLDLFIGGVGGTPAALFRNQGDGTFVDITSTAGVGVTDDTYSAAFGDYDRDGDLDLFMTHWNVPTGSAAVPHLWRNEGGGRFSAADAEAGLSFPGDIALSFTPNFADINGDRWPDLLIAGDFGTSRVFLNRQDGTFADTTSPVISDENGMGAAVGDYDNDGDLDWFVSSISDPNGEMEGGWGLSGNRLYRNRGDGEFDDATDDAGVRTGYWGWGSCFADFNNDGWLDLFHVNGYGRLDFAGLGFLLDAAAEFHHDPARLFVANGDGTFTEQAMELGIADTGQGRGVVCFDYDRDGDVDVFIANNGEAPRLYRNDGGNRQGFVTVNLRGHAPNTEAIGARISVRIGTATQVRELRAGSNFESQDPAIAHFGLGHHQGVDEVRIEWPAMNSLPTVVRDVAAGQRLTVVEP